MRRFKWWLREAGQTLCPKTTLALLASRSWVLEPEVALLPFLSAPGRVAVDAGANKGVYVFHLSRFFRSVVAFEPLPQLAGYLKRAVPANVQVQARALSDHAGTATLKLPHGFNELGSLEAHTAATWTVEAPLDEFEVELTRLDAMALGDVGFIKIDVEGHEIAVLEGARDTIARCHPALLIEIEERHNANAVARVRDLLDDFDYRGYFLDGVKLRPITAFDAGRDQNTAQLEQSVKVGRYINNFLFFEAREAADRVAVIEAALQNGRKTEFSGALDTGTAVTARQRLAGSWRAARHLFAPDALR